MRVKTTSRRGFTLIEILVVVVILGIAGAMIVPQLGTRDDQRVQAAARVLTADLMYAQNMSITQQSAYYIAFDIGHQKYSVIRSSDDTVAKHPVNKSAYVVQLGTGAPSAMQGVTIAATTLKGGSGSFYTSLGFDELGTPLGWPSVTTDALTTGTIMLQSGKCKMPVTVEPFTGQLSIGPMQ